MQIEITTYRYQRVYRRTTSQRVWCLYNQYRYDIDPAIVQYVERMLDTSKS